MSFLVTIWNIFQPIVIVVSILWALLICFALTHSLFIRVEIAEIELRKMQEQSGQDPEKEKANMPTP